MMVWIIGLLFVLQMASTSVLQKEETKENLWIDADFSSDDSLGTMVIHYSKKFNIVGLSCVFGNIGANASCPNALRLLSILNIKIQVYYGASQAIKTPFQKVPSFDLYGEDGISGASTIYGVNGAQYANSSATDALVKYFKENPGKTNIAAFGPLTNLALAQTKDKTFLSNVKSLYLMGGNIYGRGNAYNDRPSGGEYNFALDPEAARIVITGNPKITEVYPWETCMWNGIPWTDYDKAKETKTRNGRIFKAFTEKAAKLFRAVGDDGFEICDLLAAFALVDRSLISTTEAFNVTVETRGIYTNGMMVVQQVKNKTDTNVVAIKSIDKKQQTKDLMKFLVSQ